MTARFTLVHRYPFPASRVWAVATDYGALVHCCAPYLELDGLPSGRCHAGQEFDFTLSLFGRLPRQPAHMTILDCDEDAMRLSACQTGQGITFWRHDFAVQAAGAGAVLTDRVEIEAGGATSVLGVVARSLYRARHRRRRNLLRNWGGV